MIIPNITIADEPIEVPSRTWRLDFAAGRVRGSIRGGMIDGNAAIGQAAQCALLTERYAYLYLPWEYGSELHMLVGKPSDYVRAEAPRMIREALLEDDRIRDVRDFTFDGDVIMFWIDTIFGTQKINAEVPA